METRSQHQCSPSQWLSILVFQAVSQWYWMRSPIQLDSLDSLDSQQQGSFCLCPHRTLPPVVGLQAHVELLCVHMWWGSSFWEAVSSLLPWAPGTEVRLSVSFTHWINSQIPFMCTSHLSRSVGDGLTTALRPVWYALYWGSHLLSHPESNLTPLWVLYWKSENWRKHYAISCWKTKCQLLTKQRWTVPNWSMVTKWFWKNQNFRKISVSFT